MLVSYYWMIYFNQVRTVFQSGEDCIFRGKYWFISKKVQEHLRGRCLDSRLRGNDKKQHLRVSSLDLMGVSRMFSTQKQKTQNIFGKTQ